MTETEIKRNAESIITSALIAAAMDFIRNGDLAETEDGKTLLHILSAASADSCE